MTQTPRRDRCGSCGETISRFRYFSDIWQDWMTGWVCDAHGVEECRCSERHWPAPLA